MNAEDSDVSSEDSKENSAFSEVSSAYPNENAALPNVSSAFSNEYAAVSDVHDAGEVGKGSRYLIASLIPSRVVCPDHDLAGVNVELRGKKSGGF